MNPGVMAAIIAANNANTARRHREEQERKYKENERKRKEQLYKAAHKNSKENNMKETDNG